MSAFFLRLELTDDSLRHLTESEIEGLFRAIALVLISVNRNKQRAEQARLEAPR